MSGFKRLVVLVVITAWIFVVLPIAPTTAQDNPPASEIIVDNVTCTLVDAIIAANTDAVSGGCVAGNGADTIRLTTSINFTMPWEPMSPNLALPLIVSDITIEGDGVTTLQLLPEIDTPSLVLFTIGDVTRPIESSDNNGTSSNSGNKLTLRNLSLIGYEHPPYAVMTQAIQNNGGDLILDAVNVFLFKGSSAIYSYGGTLNITSSNFSNNTAERGGAIDAEHAQVTITDSNFSQNSAQYLDRDGDGGALYLKDCQYTLVGQSYSSLSFKFNQADVRGGAIYSEASHGTIQNALFANNRAINGGAIFHGLVSESVLNITDSHFINNQAEFKPYGQSMGIIGGGALFNAGMASVQRTVFWGNSGGEFGGAILDMAWSNGNGTVLFSGATLLDGVTIIGNSAEQGGAIVVTRGVQIKNSTVVANLAWRGYGGGILAFTKIFVYNSIVAQNYGGDCLAAAYSSYTAAPTGRFSGSHNLDSDATCPNSQRVTGLETVPLNNGRSTITLALTANSNAIDAGDPNFCPPTDQRRAPIVGNCDIGAFEYGAMELPEIRDPNLIRDEIAREQALEAQAAIQHQYEDQIEQYTAAIEADPTDPNNYFERGVLTYFFKNDVPSALADFHQALVADPSFWLAEYYVGLIYTEADAYKDCAKGRAAVAALKEIAPSQVTEIAHVEQNLAAICQGELGVTPSPTLIFE